jgi:hypothetical protein
MGVVRISQEYFNVLKTINSMMKMKAGLIFKGKGSDGQYTGKYYFNGICDSAMVHVIATENDVCFDEPRLQISSLPDFIKYAEATGFPKCEIKVAREKTIRGLDYDNIIFIGKDKDARIGVADDSVYADKKYMKIFNEQLKLVARLGFNAEILHSIVKDIKLIASCKALSITVTNDLQCRMLIKGSGTQQITRKIDEHCFFVEDEAECLDTFAGGRQRLFPSGSLRFMDTIGGDVNIELRRFKNSANDLMTMKGYIVKPGALLDPKNTEKDAPRSEINIVVASSEFSVKIVSNVDYFA